METVKRKEMNILFFTRTMKLGGTENVILQLCEVMKENANKIVVCSSGGVNTDKLKEMGIKHYTIPDIEKKNLLVILKVLTTLLKILKRERITIVHTHHRMAAFYSRILLFITNFTFINTSHNTFYNKKRLTKFAYKKANLIAVGNKVKENLCDFFGLPDSQITVIYNSTIPFNGNITPIEKLTKYRQDGYFLVGNIGRLSEQKGMEFFIKAVPSILRKCKNVKFFIVGDGELRNKLKSLISELSLHEDVFLLGYRNDIQNIMSQLDLIVLSSLWEGLPLTPLEAFSVGKTIVATSVDGTVEIVQDGVNGLLVQPEDAQQIADNVLKLVKQEELRKSMEQSAYVTYCEKFTFLSFERHYVDYYANIGMRKKN